MLIIKKNLKIIINNGRNLVFLIGWFMSYFFNSKEKIFSFIFNRR